MQVKVTNLDAKLPFGKEGQHPKRKLAQRLNHVNGSVFLQVEVVFYKGEVTEEMRANWSKFWQLLIARHLDKSPDP